MSLFPQFSTVVQDALLNLHDLGHPFVRDETGHVVLRFDEIRIIPRRPHGVDLSYVWEGHVIFTQVIDGVTLSDDLSIRGLQGTTGTKAV